MQAQYDFWLVTLSYVVAVIASYVALDMASRVSANRGSRAAGFWLVGGALAMGGGIWSMHFIGMLAFSLPIAVPYDIPITLLSLAFAIAASGLALYTVSGEQLSARRLALAGVVMGSGIALMHYTGMAALEIMPRPSYEPRLFALSVVIAIAASMAALWISFRLKAENILSGFWIKAGSALIMGMAIWGMHFTAMAAAVFAPDSYCLGDPSTVDNRWLATTVGFCTFLFLASALLVSMFDTRAAIRTALLEQQVERELASKTEALEASERRYRAMAEAMPIAVFTATADGTLDYLNETLIRYYGRPAAELLNADWAQFTHPDDAAVLARAFEQAISSGEPMEVMGRERRHDGEYRWHITRALPVRNQAGQVVKWIGAMLDVEDLERARAAAEDAMHAKANFLATMSHEIRTPLNATITMAGLLMDTELDSQQRDIAETIRSSGEQLLTVINDILDFSKLEAGKLELEKLPFDLRVCIEDALDMVSRQAAAKNLDLAYEIAPPTPYGLVGNADRLRQVLVNLLANAVKFTERGEVVVKVSSRPLSGTHHEIEIMVRDTGIGIAPHEQPRLFQAFSQADASTTRRFGGTGLGLAICRRLVEAMGGRIWVDSQPGKGSVFHFTARVEVAAQRSSDAIWIGGRTGLAGLRLLIVDDNGTNRRILMEHAKAWGMQSAEFGSAGEALAHVREVAPYDIAVLDYMMPEMDGLTLARELRRSYAATQMAIVILSSANLTTREIEQAQADIQGVFLKPIRQSVLYTALLEALRGPQFSPDKRRVRGRVAVQGNGTTATDMQPLRLLVAEDNPVNQKVTRLLLAKLGYRADFVSNGREAIEAVLSQPYDVVLMDVMMPEMDGFRAAQEIRARLPKEQQPRIVAVTALALEGDREKCLAAGMDDYISKPIPQQALADVLARNAPPGRRAAPAAPASDGDGAAAAGRGHELDPQTLARLRAEFGAAEAREIMAEVIADAPRLQSGLQAALEQQDAANLKLFAHTLKSMSRLVGAAQLAEEFEQLEVLGSSGTVDGAAPRGLRALERYHALMAELTQHTRPG